MTAVEERAEWLEWRRAGIGSSDVAAIVGLSPWASPYSVWADKTGRLAELEDRDSVVQEFGRRAEVMIAPWFNDRTGYYLRRFQHRCTHHAWPIARATLDALAYRTKRSAAPVGVAEFKSTGWQADWDELPDHYACQVQWQMLVADVDQAWVPALHGRRFTVYHVRRSAEDGAFLLREAQRFWRDHVEANVAPPADAHHATAAALGRIPRDATVVELDDRRDLLGRYVEARRNASAARAVVDGLANELKAALGDGQAGTVAGELVVTYPLRNRKPYTVEGGTYRALTVRWKDPADD